MEMEACAVPGQERPGAQRHDPLGRSRGQVGVLRKLRVRRQDVAVLVGQQRVTGQDRTVVAH